MADERRMSIARSGSNQARRDGIRLAVIYAAVAAVWITFSDTALALLGLPIETERFFASIKGLVYVAVTAIGLYMLSVGHLRKLYTSEERNARLFEHSAEGLMLFRVLRDDDGNPVDLVVEDANVAQSVRLRRPREQLIGLREADAVRDPRMRAYFALVRSAIEEGIAQHSDLRRELAGVDELLTAFAVEPSLYALGSVDLTDLREAQRALRRQEERIREAYVDVLDAVTGGKLILLTDREIDAKLGVPLLDVQKISSATELADARHKVSTALEDRFPELACSMELLNPLGEALNNVLKHAGSGYFGVYIKDGTVQVMVRDEGPGIDFRTLPKATLVAGFSTAATLGMGFTIMLQLCERVLISTRKGRTVVVLELHPTPASSRATEPIV